jgi:hypothetical protein
LYWMSGGAARSAQLPKLTIAANSTVSFDVASSIAAAGVKNLNGMVNLQFYIPDKSPALIMASGSVDNTHTYVFEVKPWGVLESTARSIGAWSTANGDDTMVTVWNPADEPQRLALTLFFAGGHYKLPIDLEARATRTLNISDIISAQIPDADGNTIPVGVHEGSAMLSGSQAENEHILAVVDAGTYNVRKATCIIICIDCAGLVDAWVTINPFAVLVNGQQQLTFTVQITGGSEYDDTSIANWSSSSGSATVKAGLVTGVSAGSPTVTATTTVTRAGDVCSMAPQCVTNTAASGGSPGTVGIGMAVGTFQYSGVAGGICTYKLACPSGTSFSCSATTFTIAAPCPSEYFIQDAIYYKSGSTTICSFVGSATPSSVPVSCQ